MATAKKPSVEMFTFGDADSVLDKREIFDYLEVGNNAKWYEPPLSFDDLTKLLNAAVHHASALQVKRNILVSTFVPSALMTTAQFSRFSLDYLVLGNTYYEANRSRLGTPLTGDVLPAKFMKRGLKSGQFFYVPKPELVTEYMRDVFHLMEPDINQEIYGMPQYLAALQSVLLNESATLFRRRYYKNGSHAGYILYMTDAAQNQGDVDALRKALKDSKGPGNFRNLFMYAPNGKKDGIQLIPVAEVAAKDEFVGIKNISRDDILAAHRIPPQLMGIIPNNTGGFGDVEKAARVFMVNEIQPLQARMMELNEWLGVEAVRFKAYELSNEIVSPPVQKNSSQYAKNNYKWIGVDLDGTLAKTTHSVSKIGEAVQPMLNRVKNWRDEGRVVKIFTARFTDSSQHKLIQEWLDKYGIGDLEITNVKDFNMIQLWDDKAKRVIRDTGYACCD